MIDQKPLLTLNQKLKKISDELEETAKKIKIVAVQELTSEVNEMRNTIILEMQRGTKTGEKYKRGKHLHQASGPGEYPAVDRGELLTSIFYDVDESKMEVELGNLVGAPYGGFLEEGTKKMEPRKWLEPTVDKHEDELVKHIGNVVFRELQKPFEGIH